MVYVWAAIVGLAFGMADQYLGSISRLGAWVAAVSQMAAPWFALPFLAGMTQQRTSRAIAVGLVVTVAALVGYFAMTCSPVENVAAERFSGCFLTVISSPYNPLWFAGGLVTGPLFGLLGHRWRVERSWISAALLTGALCLEPLARRVVGIPTGPTVVWGAEIAIGVLVGATFAFVIVTSRQVRAPTARQDLS